MCKYNIDEICVNADCPYRADYCPCYEDDSICKFRADKEKNAPTQATDKLH